MNLLDRAVKLAAEQDEPEEMNFVRKHAREQVSNPLLCRLVIPGSYLAVDGTTASTVPPECLEMLFKPYSAVY